MRWSRTTTPAGREALKELGSGLGVGRGDMHDIKRPKGVAREYCIAHCNCIAIWCCIVGVRVRSKIGVGVELDLGRRVRCRGRK